MEIYYNERQQSGKVLAVCISKEKGSKKTNISKGNLINDFGLQGDAHSGKWHRQISLLAIESINKMRDKGLELDFGDFAENITTENIRLHKLPVGTRLRLGKEIELEVTQIGKECHQGCEIFQQIGSCIMPLEGIFARVLHGGPVEAGLKIEVLEIGGTKDD